MTHLTQEQFEDALAGRGGSAEHLAACQGCRCRLAELGAVRERLRRSFESIHADAALTQQVTAAADKSPAARPRWTLTARVLRWPAMAAAAAILVAAGVWFHVASSSNANAAQVELVDIHRQNLSGKVEMMTDPSPQKLKEFLDSRVKGNVPMPVFPAGMKIEGCCVARYKGAGAACYLVKTAQAPVSIVVLDDRPAAMGLKRAGGSGGLEFWSAQHGECQIAAVICPCGHVIYAVGETSADELQRVLTPIRLDCCPPK